MHSKEQLPQQTEVSQLAEALGTRFVQRRDVYARQIENGAYVFVREPLTTDLLVAHLRGEMTLGSYVLDAQSQARYMVLDADDAPDWRRLQALATVLAEEGSMGYLEHSRRGGHLWYFLDAPMPGQEVRAFGQGLLNHFGIKDIELFPKQDKLSSGPGSLIRLPFGVHRKSGRRYGFYDPDGTPLAPSLREQISALSVPETLSEEHLERFSVHWATVKAQQPQRRPERPRRRFEVGEDMPSAEQIRAAMPIRAFVLNYVELSPSGRGLCPFHDDHNPSFAINDDKDFWYCFACETGGSVIDFYMQWNDCDFKTAVAELAERGVS